jgi:hypothetical protein
LDSRTLRRAAAGSVSVHCRQCCRDIRVLRSLARLTVIIMTTLVQVDLRSGSRYRTCWVEPRVRVGDQITLRNSDDPRLRWDVLRVGEQRRATDIKRDWSNNI